MGLDFVKVTFPAENVTFHKGDLSGWKGLVKVTFNSLFLNFKGPISETWSNFAQ